MRTSDTRSISCSGTRRAVVAATALAALFVFQSLPLSAQSYYGPTRVLEDYYYYVALGYARNYYPPDTKEAIDELSDDPDLSRFPGNFEFGVYWPIPAIGAGTVLGAVASGAGDFFTVGNDASLDFSVVQLGPSLQYYFMKVPGEGIYGRADLGIAVANYAWRAGDLRRESSGNVGVGLLGSVGWAFPVSIHTSLNVAIGAAWRSLPGYETGQASSTDIFEKGDYTSLLFNVAVFW